MKTKFIAYLLLILATMALPVMADDIPYPDPTTIAPTDVFTATATGNIEGYFYGASASDTDTIQMCDVTASYCSAFTFNNQTTAVGTESDFGAVTAGDVLVFNLDNTTAGYIVSSDPADSVDGINHAYATAYTDTGSTAIPGIPAGTFIGMEDLAYPGSDLDYNDDEFVYTDVSAAVATPEPAGLLLLAVGILGLGVFGLRRRQLC